MARRVNYGFSKRQKEIKKQKKQAEKAEKRRLKREAAAADGSPDEATEMDESGEPLLDLEAESGTLDDTDR